MVSLFVQKGGSGNQTYVLLHGLGCSSDVWRGLISVIEKNKAGKWIAPDMRGHGRSEWQDSYALGYHATDLIPIIRTQKNIFIVGHSMGALVAMVLATGIFDLSIKGVLGIGPKSDWPAEERKRLIAFANKPIRWFKSREEAIERYLLVSGLKGILNPGDDQLSSAIFQGPEGFRLSADPKTVIVGGPAKGLHAAASYASNIRLACGEYDNVTTIDGLRTWDPGAVVLRGLSHNAHVEDPNAVWSVIQNMENNPSG